MASGELAQFVHDIAFPPEGDEDFYTAHRIELIDGLVRFARSTEFAALAFNVKTNDAFRYIVLYLIIKGEYQSDYDIRVNAIHSKFVVSFVAIKDGYAGKRVNGNLPREIRHVPFDTLEALFAYLEPLKAMMVEITEFLRHGEP